ncbi:fructose-bisphosphate aldolase class I [Candidatus Saccharibacteria bacterium]|nr:fructose-bisphosphate aldolase class I [Candidatus Saccharibacteria bacterium]
MNELRQTATQLMADNKGLLAADESSKSAQKRFDSLQIPCTAETRLDYRYLLFSTPNINQYLSGVILFDETLHQSTPDGMPIPDYLTSLGIIPGIKVDKGLVELNNFPNETITEGLDGLQARCAEYYRLGARFAKWRAAFSIGPSTPSQGALHANLHTMARYASICQAAGLVPIVEPEILYEGSHTIEQSKIATKQAIDLLMSMLKAYRVQLDAVILKTSMVLAGKQTTQSSPEEVATATLEVLLSSADPTLAGIVFLSGGQTPDQATANLAAIGQLGKQPWPISFSFSRAVQDPVMSTWNGDKANIAAAQQVYFRLTERNAKARHGHMPDQPTSFNRVSSSQDS